MNHQRDKTYNQYHHHGNGVKDNAHINGNIGRELEPGITEGDCFLIYSVQLAVNKKIMPCGIKGQNGGEQQSNCTKRTGKSFQRDALDNGQGPLVQPAY